VKTHRFLFFLFYKKKEMREGKKEKGDERMEREDI